ncbi:MAG: hypothetical protein U0235_14100 [Polyangiaceae bacterium]
MRICLLVGIALVSTSACGRSLDESLGGDTSSDAGPRTDAAPTAPMMDAAAGGVVVGVSATGSGSGTVRSEPEGISCGSDCLAAFETETVTLAAEPAANSTFTGWEGACTGTNDCVVSRRDGILARVVATWGRVPVALHVRTDGTGSGSVTGDQGIQCPSVCDASVGMDTTVKLMPSPASGSLFTGWQGCTSTQGIACLVTMTASTDVVATFDACPATTADGARYVDHILGRDDDAHGGAAGGCAYRTISYALEHAPSDIYLAHGNYPGNVHEDDKPLYLTGNQVLHGDAADRTAVVLNPHASSGWGNSIHFVGARNGVTVHVRRTELARHRRNPGELHPRRRRLPLHRRQRLPRHVDARRVPR